MKTSIPNIKDYEKKWLLFDASEEVLGRLASKIAMHLMGKNKVDYTPFLDTGDFVVVINAQKIKYTGNNKSEQKMYYKHTGYLGNMKESSLSDMLLKKPEDVIKLAVKNMLPKTRMGRAMFDKLRVYAGSEHPHEAQKPEKSK